jgi:hypothetical protein
MIFHILYQQFVHGDNQNVICLVFNLKYHCYTKHQLNIIQLQLLEETTHDYLVQQY